MMKNEIDFLGKRKIALIFSSLLIIVSIVSLAINGLKLGIDFTGGTLVEVGYKQPADIGVLRKELNEAGFEEATVQNFGTTRDVLIRLKPQEGVSNAELSGQVLAAVNKNLSEPADIRRVEFVGPQVGDELAEDGWAGIAVFYVWYLALCRLAI